MSLNLRGSAARLFIAGFSGKSVSSELTSLLDLGVSGAILFTRNVEAPAQVAELTRAIKQRAGRPFLTSVDQEGGNVARLRDGFTRVPAMQVLGRADDANLSYEVGRVLGRELRAVGIDLDYAPVLDVNTNPENPVIGPRSFGADPELVAWHATALAKGLVSEGVAACGKHFPGHGDTLQDSHHQLPRLPHALERLERIELLPFSAAVKAGFPAIMTAHVVFEALDPEWPATTSKAALSGLLRGKLGYEGVIITDDLEMKAIADHYPLEEVIVRGLDAGVDLFLCCHTHDKVIAAVDAVERAVLDGRIPLYRFQQAVARVEAFTKRWASPPLERFDASLLRSPESLSVIQRLEAAAASVEEGRDPTEY
jgi:beta-N-acetylhexosaminidase